MDSGHQGEGGFRGPEREFGLAEVSHCTGWTNSEALLYSTGNHSQYPMINYTGKEYLKKNVCIYISESLG